MPISIHQPSDDELPFRLKQSTFRQYEPFIDAAIKQSPEVLSINPAPLRPTTFAARLRDACISYERFHWDATFSRIDFETCYEAGLLTVSHGDKCVTVGPKLSRRGSPAGQCIAVNNPNDKRIDGIFVDRPITNPLIVAFCQLLSAKLICGPVILKFNQLSEASITELEANYDIAITHNDKGHYIII